MKGPLWTIALIAVFWTTVIAATEQGSGDLWAALIMGWLAWGAVIVLLFFWTFDIRTRR